LVLAVVLTGLWRLKEKFRVEAKSDDFLRR